MSVEEIYQEHIKQLPREEQLKLLAKVAAELSQNESDTEDEINKRSIMELHGLGSEIWKDIDAQDYVDKLRGEWEHRP